MPDPALLDRSVAASTLVAGLELAREGALTLEQEEGFGPITVRGIESLEEDGTERTLAASRDISVGSDRAFDPDRGSDAR